MRFIISTLGSHSPPPLDQIVILRALIPLPLLWDSRVSHKKHEKRIEEPKNNFWAGVHSHFNYRVIVRCLRSPSCPLTQSLPYWPVTVPTKRSSSIYIPNRLLGNVSSVLLLCPEHTPPPSLLWWMSRQGVVILCDTEAGEEERLPLILADLLEEQRWSVVVIVPRACNAAKQAFEGLPIVHTYCVLSCFRSDPIIDRQTI